MKFFVLSAYNTHKLNKSHKQKKMKIMIKLMIILMIMMKIMIKTMKIIKLWINSRMIQ